MKLHEIARELQELLGEHFRTVRVTAIQNADQFLAELTAVNPDKLPGVLVVFDNFQFVATGTIREDRIACSPKADFAAMALGLIVSQGI